MQVTQNIKLNIYQTSEYLHVSAKQADDNSRFLKITFTDGVNDLHVPGDAIVSLRALKPDKTSVLDSGVVNEDGTVTVELTDQVLAVEGIVRADVMTSQGGEILSTATFLIRVGAVPIGTEVVSSNEFLQLVELYEDISELMPVDTDNIVDGAVTTPKLADDAVTNDKIADSAVNTDNLADGAVTNVKIADGTITGNKFVPALPITEVKSTNSGANYEQSVTTKLGVTHTALLVTADHYKNALGAVNFSSTTEYEVGDYVVYNKKTYKCITAHTGSWANADFEETQIFPRLDDVEESVTEINSELTNFMTFSTEPSLFVIGSINSVNGEDLSVGNRMRTNRFKNVIGITAESGYSFLVFAYNGAEYVGSWNGASFTPSSVAFVTEFKFDLTLSYDYRIVVKRSDDASININEALNIIFETQTDSTLTEKYKAADAKATGDSIRGIESALESISTDGRIDMFELANISSFSSGKAINGSGVAINESKSYCTEYFIDVEENMRVFSQLTLITHTSFYQYIAFYDSNKTFLSRVGGSTVYNIDESVPSNAKYCRVTLSYVNTTAQPANVSSFEFAVYYPLNLVTTSPKNKWYVLGDSISAGYYSLLTADVPQGLTPIITYEDGTCSIWDQSLNHNYWGYINKWFLGRELIGKGYPGQGYFRNAANSQNGIYVVKNTDFSDAGLITVAWGLNDWHYNMVRGNHNLIDDSVPYPTTGYDTSQLTTVNHAIWYCLGELIRKAPKAKIVVQTPMNAWRYGGDFSTNWGIGQTLSQSGKLSDIHDDIKYWADYYGLQVLDLTYNNSIVNKLNIKDMIIDGSHPSDECHKQLARSIWSFIGY